jgi:hypothetical protein
MENHVTELPLISSQPLAARKRPRSRFEHYYLLPICFVIGVVFAWMATAGTWQFLFPGSLFYDAQASSLWHGRLDVPLSAIGSEAFIRNGKFYGYFGIGPALPRMVLDAIWPRMFGLWTRLSLMLACAVNLPLTARLAIEGDRALSGDRPGRWRKFVIGLFVITATLGSTTLFIVSVPSIFHEAIMWGATLSLACGYFAVRYVREERRWLLVMMCACGVLGLFCRASVGAGSVLLMLLLSVRSIHRSRLARQLGGGGGQRRGGDKRGLGDAAIAGACAIVAAALFFSINYAKFRTFESIPLRLYSYYANRPRLLRLSGGHHFYIENVPAGFCNVFKLGPIEHYKEFPWFIMTDRVTRFSQTRMVWVEPYCPIPTSEPALTLFALTGIIAMAWKGSRQSEYRLATICTFCGAAVVLASISISERYMHDFYPFLVLAGSAGSAKIGAIKTTGARRAVAELLIFLLILSVLLLSAFTLLIQRAGFEPIPQAARDQFNAWAHWWDKK